MTRKGFLLLEVIVSIALVGIGGVVIARAYRVAQQSLIRSREYNEFSALIDQVFWEHDLEGAIAQGTTQGSFDEHPDIEWVCDVRPSSNPAYNEVSIALTNKSDFGIPREEVNFIFPNREGDHS